MGIRIMFKRELPDIPDREVKIVKPILTQEDVKELFEYRDGDLYWKIDVSYKAEAGTKLSSMFYHKKYNIFYKTVVYQGKRYMIPRLIFLGYFNTKEEAEKVYLDAWYKLHSNFNNKCKS
jgi:hypothetical protein